MHTNVPMRIPADVQTEFTNERITDIKKAFIKSLAPASAYVIAVDKREEAINANPMEHIRHVDDLVDAMESQSYELQLACYLQGVADGGLTLAQLTQFIDWKESA